MRTNLAQPLVGPPVVVRALGPSRSYQRSPSPGLHRERLVFLSALTFILVTLFSWTLGYVVGRNDRAQLDNTCAQCIEQPMKPEGARAPNFQDINHAAPHKAYSGPSL